MKKTNRFYPIAEIQKLEGFRFLSTKTLLEQLTQLDEMMQETDYKLKVKEWQFITDALVSRFNIAIKDKHICFMMACFMYDMMYEIDNENNIIYTFKPKSDIQMHFYATTKNERYKELFEISQDPVILQLKELYIKEMKQFFEDNYNKIHKYFYLTREQVSRFDYEDWVNFSNEIKDYNNELKKKNKPIIQFNNRDKDKKEAHRPEGSNIINNIQQIEEKTNVVIKTYSSIKEIIETNEGYTKAGLSQVLNGKRRKYKGYIWKSVNLSSSTLYK